MRSCYYSMYNKITEKFCVLQIYSLKISGLMPKMGLELFTQKLWLYNHNTKKNNNYPKRNPSIIKTCKLSSVCKKFSKHKSYTFKKINDIMKNVVCWVVETKAKYTKRRDFFRINLLKSKDAKKSFQEKQGMNVICLCGIVFHFFIATWWCQILIYGDKQYVNQKHLHSLTLFLAYHLHKANQHYRNNHCSNT